MSVMIPSAADKRLLDERGGARSMVWIMAIMLFLTVLAGALGLGTRSAATLLGRQLAGRLTVQIVEPVAAKRAARTQAALRALRTLPQVTRVTEVNRAELAGLLRPWLGGDGADPDLPIPAMIDVDLASTDASAVDAATRAVARAAPGARVDRHESWMSPISRFLTLMTAFAGSLVLLMAGATAAVVVLAARAGLESHRPTIEVLHMLGSTDVQVARLFQRRIALDTLIGGGVGAVLAVGAIVAMGSQLAGLGSDLISGIALDAADWIALALLPAGFVVLATLAARVAVLRSLRKTL